MIIVALIGLKKSGKTTTAEALIREFKRRGFIVGGIKFMPNSTFTLDKEGKDTYRHRSAGADFVISLSKGEIAYIGDIQGRARLSDALRMVPDTTEVLICEGLNEDHPDIQRVLIARDPDSLKETVGIRRIKDGIIAVSGIIANELSEHPEYPVFNCTKETGVSGLADLILDIENSSKQ
ncbi:MAG: molybdopterin-guanine dinucleotide biosynthesis protein B [Thermoplasmatota archaeon]